MAVYTTAYNYIQDDVNRPDMEAAILRYIQRAVIAGHRMDYWRKDLIEQVHVFQAEAMLQLIDLTLYPRFRSVGYIRKWSSIFTDIYSSNPTEVGIPTGGAFEEINPEKMLDGYGYDRRNTMYRAGDAIKLNSDVGISKVFFGWFRDPIIEPIADCDSWILEKYPDWIAAMAKIRIFKNIGKDDESAAARSDLAIETMILQTNNVRLQAI